MRRAAAILAGFCLAAGTLAAAPKPNEILTVEARVVPASATAEHCAHRRADRGVLPRQQPHAVGGVPHSDVGLPDPPGRGHRRRAAVPGRRHEEVLVRREAALRLRGTVLDRRPPDVERRGPRSGLGKGELPGVQRHAVLRPRLDRFPRRTGELQRGGFGRGRAAFAGASRRARRGPGAAAGARLPDFRAAAQLARGLPSCSRCSSSEGSR